LCAFFFQLFSWGEFICFRALKDAADVIMQSPTALQLRYLQTLTTIASEKNSTIVFPIPVMKMMTGLDITSYSETQLWRLFERAGYSKFCFFFLAYWLSLDLAVILMIRTETTINVHWIFPNSLFFFFVYLDWTNAIGHWNISHFMIIFCELTLFLCLLLSSFFVFHDLNVSNIQWNNKTKSTHFKDQIIRDSSIYIF